MAPPWARRRCTQGAGRTERRQPRTSSAVAASPHHGRRLSSHRRQRPNTVARWRRRRGCHRPTISSVAYSFVRSSRLGLARCSRRHVTLAALALVTGSASRAARAESSGHLPRSDPPFRPIRRCAVIEHDQLVGVADGRDCARSRSSFVPPTAGRHLLRTSRSVSASRELVARRGRGSGGSAGACARSRCAASLA